MGKKAKWTIAVVAVIAIAGVLGMSAAKRGNKAVEVRMETVQKHDLVASVTASGQVSPQTKVDVASDLSGKIMKLSVKEGQMVSEGQFLLQIDPSQPQAEVDRSNAAVESAKAQMNQAATNLDQAQKSFDRSAAMQKVNKQFVTDEQMEQLQTAVDVNKSLVQQSKHAVDQATASLNDAKSALAKTTIYAPMAGQITRLDVEQGETAVPGTFNKDAATLLTISDMSVLETLVKVDETDVARIKLGDSADVQIDAFPDTTFIGKVTKISNSSVKSTTTTTADQAVDYEVTIQLLNAPKDTRPDFSATAKVITDKRNGVLAVPIIALTVRENQEVQSGDTAVGLGRAKPTKEVGKKDVEGVFVVGTDNKVTFRAVKVGIAGEKDFEVVGGLKEGEKIVAGTYQAIRELKDGALVRETKVDAKKPTPGTKS
jgi:HlyD family secretion protein